MLVFYTVSTYFDISGVIWIKCIFMQGVIILNKTYFYALNFWISIKSFLSALVTNVVLSICITPLLIRISLKSWNIDFYLHTVWNHYTNKKKITFWTTRYPKYRDLLLIMNIFERNNGVLEVIQFLINALMSFKTKIFLDRKEIYFTYIYFEILYILITYRKNIHKLYIITERILIITL